MEQSRTQSSLRETTRKKERNEIIIIMRRGKIIIIMRRGRR